MWNTSGSLAGALVPIIATVIIAAMVTLAGGQFGGVAAPFPDAVDRAAVTCVDEAVRPVGQASFSGRARICFSRAGIQTIVDLENLSEAVTYTAWLAYFSRPDLCSTSPCGDSELAQGDPTGMFERIDAATADITRRASLTRTFRELHPQAGSETQILVFHRGSLGRVNPSDRIRLLVEWPLTGVTYAAETGADRHVAGPLIGRAVIRLLAGSETSEGDRRLRRSPPTAGSRAASRLARRPAGPCLARARYDTPPPVQSGPKG